MEEQIAEYLTELKSLLQKSIDSFEKQLNYISAGSIGLSMLIVEKLFKDISSTNCKFLIISAWSFFGLTLMSNLLSHLYTFYVHSKTIVDIQEDKYDDKFAKNRNEKIKLWNWISVCFLLLGIVSFIIFISINI